MTKLIKVAMLLAVMITFSACAKVRVPPDPAIDAIVEPYAQVNDFHGIVALASSGKLVSLNAYGFANIDRRIRHDDVTRFLTGSMSKQFTAGVVLKLEEAGLLSTSDIVSEYLPTFPRADAFTLHHLLVHEAGIPDIYSLPEYGELRSDPQASLGRMVEALGRQPLSFEPGSSFMYSNGGYTLLAKIIEVASDASYGAAVERYVAAPLRLTDTGHLGWTDAEHAVGYDPDGVSSLRQVDPPAPAVLAGSGSIVSSARDLAVWIDAIQTGEFLSDFSRGKMLADHGNGYGYGLSVYQYADTPVWEHDGRLSGWSSDIAYYAALDTAVIILANVQSTLRDRIRNNIADLLFEKPLRQYEMRPTDSIQLGENQLEAFTGSYSFGGGFVVHVRAGDGVLVLRANEGEESDFYPVDSTTYFSRTLYATTRFTLPPDTMVYSTGTNEFAGVRE